MIQDPLKPLPVHVKPRPGESLMSLIVRAADANVYPRTSQLLALAGITTLRPEFVPFTKQRHAEAIAQRLGLPVGEIALRMHSPAPSIPTPDWVDWFGTPIPRDFIDAETFRYSAASLKQAAFHRAMWMLKPLKFCCESMQYLAAICPHCDRKLGWKYGRRPDVCEKCKRPLADADSTYVASSLQATALAAASVVDPNKEVRRSALSQMPDLFADWHAGEVFAAMVELGAVTSHSLTTDESAFISKVRHGDFSNYTTEHLVRGYTFMRRWPSGFREFLPAIITTDIKSGPLGKYLYGERSPSRLRELIRSAFSIQVREMESPVYASRGFRACWIRSDGLITQKDAVIEFQIGQAPLRRLDNGGRCIPTKGCRVGTKAYIRESLKNSVTILRASVHQHKCAQAVGVPAYCIAALADRGLLKAVEDHDACLMATQPIYARNSLHELIQAISKAQMSANQKYIAIDDLMRGRFHPEDWADLVRELALGKLRATQKCGSSIESYFVDGDDAERFRRELPERKLPDNMSVPVITASRLLGVNEPAVLSAITAGLIPGRRASIRRIDITLRDIGKFYARYFVSSEARLRYGLHGRTFGWRMKQAGFVSVSTIYKLTVWTRNEVEQVFGAGDPLTHAGRLERQIPTDGLGKMRNRVASQISCNKARSEARPAQRKSS